MSPKEDHDLMAEDKKEEPKRENAESMAAEYVVKNDQNKLVLDDLETLVRNVMPILNSPILTLLAVPINELLAQEDFSKKESMRMKNIRLRRRIEESKKVLVGKDNTLALWEKRGFKTDTSEEGNGEISALKPTFITEDKIQQLEADRSSLLTKDNITKIGLPALLEFSEEESTEKMQGRPENSEEIPQISDISIIYYTYMAEISEINHQELIDSIEKLTSDHNNATTSEDVAEIVEIVPSNAAYLEPIDIRNELSQGSENSEETRKSNDTCIIHQAYIAEIAMIKHLELVVLTEDYPSENVENISEITEIHLPYQGKIVPMEDRNLRSVTSSTMNLIAEVAIIDDIIENDHKKPLKAFEDKTKIIHISTSDVFHQDKIVPTVDLNQNSFISELITDIIETAIDAAHQEPITNTMVDNCNEDEASTQIIGQSCTKDKKDRIEYSLPMVEIAMATLIIFLVLTLLY